MFKCFQHKKNKQFQSYMEKFVLPECKKGSLRFFDDAQRVFILCSDRQMQIDVATANERLLHDISIKYLLWLSGNFRKWHDEYYSCMYCDTLSCIPNLPVYRKRYAHLTDGQYHATLKLGTFSSNGYYRQQCMEQLWDVEGSLPYLILRMNDWVARIREKAYELSAQRMQTCGLYEFFQSLPMLERVKNARRRDHVRIHSLECQMQMLIRQKFQTLPYETLDSIHTYEIQIKNAIYRFINRNQVLDRERMERLLAAERTGYGQMLLILAIFRHCGYDSLYAEKYLHAKSAVVRYHTLVFRYEKEHVAWDGLQTMLLDPSRRIRDYAGYILKKCTDIDILSFYLKELDRNISKVALSGIGENGTKAQVPLIVPYLHDTRETICKAALYAYGKLAGTDGEEVYWTFLFDTRQVLARQAYRFVRKYDISYGAPRLYEAYTQNRSSFIADYLLRLLLNEPFWKRLPYLLTLCCEGELTEIQQQMVTAGICCGYMYGSVSVQQAEVIRGLLTQCEDKIPAFIRKGILFDLEHITTK